MSCTGVTNVIMANGNGGDDNITVAAATTRRAFLDGGAGADKLTGGAGADNLRGGVGVNEMRGGDGADDVQGCSSEDELLFGEAGDDIITTCDGASKQLIGGPGDDFMSSNVSVGPGRHDRRRRGGRGLPVLARAWGHGSNVSVSLDDQPNDGAAGGTSNMHSDVEDIITAGGSDTITGSAGPNTIRSDTSSTGYSSGSTNPPGNDTIDPGGGADHVYAGGGDDTIMSRDGAADVVNCGSNIASPFSPGLPPVDNDTVTADGADAFVACEHV